MRIISIDEYNKAYQESVDDPEKFWSGIARHFTWHRRHNTVLEWNFDEPSVKWFSGAQLNITENCIDRHLDRKGNDAAFIWEPNEPDQRAKTISYNQLAAEVNRLANALKKLGISKGDRVCIYMPMIPEAVYGMLACARIGAVHSVVFGGFSARALAERHRLRLWEPLPWLLAIGFYFAEGNPARGGTRAARCLGTKLISAWLA